MVPSSNTPIDQFKTCEYWKEQCQQLIKDGYGAYKPYVESNKLTTHYSMVGMFIGRDITPMTESYQQLAMAADTLASESDCQYEQLSERHSGAAPPNPELSISERKVVIQDKAEDLKNLNIEETEQALSELERSAGGLMVKLHVELQKKHKRLVARDTRYHTNPDLLETEFQDSFDELKAALASNEDEDQQSSCMTFVNCSELWVSKLEEQLREMDPADDNQLSSAGFLKNKLSRFNQKQLAQVGIRRNVKPTPARLTGSVTQSLVANTSGSGPESSLITPQTYNQTATTELTELLSNPVNDIDWAQANSLLEKGADPFDFRTRTGFSCNTLFRIIDAYKHCKASPGKNFERVKFLSSILKGHDSAQLFLETSRDFIGHTPLTAALTKGDKEAAQTIYHYLKQQSELEALLTCPNISSRVNVIGNETPLVLAIKAGDEKLACQLIKYYNENQLREPCTASGLNALELAHYAHMDTLLPLLAEKAHNFRYTEACHFRELYIGRGLTPESIIELKHLSPQSPTGTYSVDRYAREMSIATLAVQQVKPILTPGFQNFGNTCFANAALKQIIIGMEPDQPERIKKATKNLIQERKELAIAFADLADAMIRVRRKAPTTGKKTPEELHENVMVKLRAFAHAADSDSWSQEDQDYQSLMRKLLPKEGYPQQDSQEFIGPFIELVCLRDDSQELKTFKQTVSVNGERSRQFLQDGDVYHQVIIHDKFNLAQALACRKEEIPDVEWTDQATPVLLDSEMMERVAHDNPGSLKTVKIHARLFDFDREKALKGDLRIYKLSGHASALLGSNPVYELPIYNLTTKKEEFVPFEVQSVVAQSGSTIQGGHYFTIESCGDHCIIHDDDQTEPFNGTVFDFFNSYADTAPYLIELKKVMD
ncbi:hypothetical protein EOPP23_05620 [Endozoicomonas sp. OPT23]|uniref:hypothetical protein n=1 Tax=Endozoicomonas sp. OPT23 TaxID=2072845 RepID=UPI00129AD77D|nr:hypothetical protein [Endozoicomonas sp. OPT23]MRI32463.1 hypothetical protein [Endozoicomonas sp. OPT23]